LKHTILFEITGSHQLSETSNSVQFLVSHESRLVLTVVHQQDQLGNLVHLFVNGIKQVTEEGIVNLIVYHPLTHLLEVLLLQDVNQWLEVGVYQLPEDAYINLSTQAVNLKLTKDAAISEGMCDALREYNKLPLLGHLLDCYYLY